MSEFKWDELKNKRLKDTRGVSFEEILGSVFLSLEKHSTRSNQFIMLFEYKEYIFLKTLFPSRKYTQKYK